MDSSLYWIMSITWKMYFWRS